MSTTFVNLLVVDCEGSAVVERLPHYRRLLTPDELTRVDAYMRPDDRVAHLVTAALVRWGLMRFTGFAPETMVFAREEHGKPYLSRPTSRMTFNASQSGRFVVAAFAEARRVGVDIERVDPRIDVVEQATYTFSPDERALLAATPASRQRDLFFRLWSLKEAYAKAKGTGLSTNFAGFSALPVDAEHARLAGVEPAGWHLRSVGVAEGYAAALAIEDDQVAPSVALHLEQTIPFA